MRFTTEDLNQTCLLKDGKPATIVEINWQSEPVEVAAQVPGEDEARYIAGDKFERVRGAIVQVRE